MSGVGLTVTIHGAEARWAFDDLARRIGNATPLMAAIGTALVETKHEFTLETAGLGRDEVTEVGRPLVHQPSRMQQAEGRIRLDKLLHKHKNLVHGFSLRVNLLTGSVH